MCWIGSLAGGSPKANRLIPGVQLDSEKVDCSMRISRSWIQLGLVVFLAGGVGETGSAQFLRELRSRAKETPQPEPTVTPVPERTPSLSNNRRSQQRNGRGQSESSSDSQGGQTSSNDRRVSAALATEKLPKDALTRYVGKWKGSLWVYGPGGDLQERKTVQVECKMVADGKMEMSTFMFDLVGRQLVVVETSTYQIVAPDRIRVSIKRPTGKVETQNGRWNDNALFLTSVRSDGVEHFRERISDDRLLMDGYGIYGNHRELKNHTVFVGRLTRER